MNEQLNLKQNGGSHIEIPESVLPSSSNSKEEERNIANQATLAIANPTNNVALRPIRSTTQAEPKEPNPREKILKEPKEHFRIRMCYSNPTLKVGT